MLAEIGFFATGICFAAFAYTFKIFVIDKTKLQLEQFPIAYFFLAMALLTWGVAVAVGGDRLLKNSVLVGDFFLLFGTVFMLDLLLGPTRRFWLLLASAIGLVLFYIRGNHYPPMPHMQSGILIFNTQRPVAFVLGAMFLLIWLPVNLRVAKIVTARIKEDGISQLYSYIYTAATLSALIFIAARRTVTVALSFAAVGICFLMLLASNLLVEVVEDKHGASKPARHK